MGLLTMLIGPRGGGKTTGAAMIAKEFRAKYPNVPVVSNLPIEDCIYVSDILKFLATKLIVEGGEKSYTYKSDGTVHITPREHQPMFMVVIIDEGAISGFESRGSGLYSLNTYLLALSRKLHVDIWLISQLMSMIDKRGQWLADYYWLCVAVMIPGTTKVDYFTFTIFNEQFERTATYTLEGKDAEKYIFGTFDTDDIPSFEELALAFRKQNHIDEFDHRFYNRLVEYYRGMAEMKKENKQDEWFARRWIAFWGAA